MSWNPPSGHIYATGEIVTASTLNVYVKDNLDDLDRRTTPVGAGVATSESTPSTTYTNLTTGGPAVTATIGATFKALVTLRAALANANVPVASYMGVAISGASTFAAADSTAIGFTSTIASSGIRTGMVILYTALGAGSTTFTAKYRTDGGGNMTAVDRAISVTPLGS